MTNQELYETYLNGNKADFCREVMSCNTLADFLLDMITDFQDGDISQKELYAMALTIKTSIR